MASVTLGALPLHDVDDSGVRWNVESLAGWEDSGSTIQPVQRVRAHGAWAGDAFLPPRRVTVQGTILGETREATKAALHRLRAAAALGDAPLVVNDAGEILSATVRREDVVLSSWLGDRSVRYSVQLVAPDPRKFGGQFVDTTPLPSTAGGLTVPFTVPFSIGATTISGQLSLTNPGNIAGPVRLRIDGPVTGPVVTHVTSGESLVFASSIALGAGEWLDVDLEARTVLANGQSSRNQWVTSRGWFSFEPGDNTWAFSAAVYDAASRLTVLATPAWM